MEIKNRRLNPGCKNAANPFHECGEYCAGGEPRAPAAPAAQNGARSKEQQGKSHGSGRTKMVDASCANASNPFHQCADYCSRKASEGVWGPTGRERSVGNSVRMTGTRKVDPACPNASNPFHICTEHCSQSQRRHARTQSDGSFTLRERKRELKTVGRKDVHPNCANASNPFHKCSDYCLQRE